MRTTQSVSTQPVSTQSVSTPSASYSRRRFLKFGIGTTLGLGLAASGLSVLGNDATKVGAVVPISDTVKGGVTTFIATPTAPPPFTAPVLVIGPAPKILPVLAAVSVTAYHDVTGATHQSRFNSLGASGYRMISLNISGSPDDPRYAAVWVQRAGAAQRAVHGVTAAQYQQWFDAGVAEGFFPTLVSATGPAASARFAAVAEQGIAGPGTARHHIDADAFDFQTVVAVGDGLIARSVAVYGDPGARRFAGVWLRNTRSVDWPMVTDVTPEQYQQSFNALTSRGFRPRTLAVAGDGKMTAVFGNNDDAGAWVARHNLTSAQYQGAFNEYTGNGLIPVCVAAGGVGSATRYAAIFVPQAALGLYL